MKRPRGIPGKVQIQVPEPESDASTKSDISLKPKTTEAKKTHASNNDDMKTKRLLYKYDHLEGVREQQNQRYQKIKRDLQLKRLCHTIFSEKLTDEQRAKLAEELINRKPQTIYGQY